MKTVAIIQARMSSSRLPGKSLMLICGQPLLLHVINRVGSAEGIDQVIVATSLEKSDDPIVDFCQSYNISYSRGPLDNVLQRYYQAAIEHHATTIVRITGDCPLIDPSVIDDVIHLHQVSGVEYSSNVDPYTFPDGMDTEVFSFHALEVAFNNAHSAYDMEHVTTYIRAHKNLISQNNLRSEKNLSNIKISVDTKSDFDTVKSIFDNLYNTNKTFRLRDILKEIDHDYE